MKFISKEELIKIGFISKPHGFKGELILAVENGDAEDYEHVKFLFIEQEGKPVPFHIEEIKIRSSDILLKTEDVNTEAEAKLLTGKSVYVETSEVSSEEGDLEWTSLIGFKAIEKTHGELGLIEGIEEFPQQVIAHCMVNGKEVLFPLNDDFISSIDEEKKEIHLELPEGLLDVYLK
jgi:16S rRNA processing protein RimM